MRRHNRRYYRGGLTQLDGIHDHNQNIHPYERGHGGHTMMDGIHDYNQNMHPYYYGGGVTQLDGIYDYNQNIHPYYQGGGQTAERRAPYAAENARVMAQEQARFDGLPPHIQQIEQSLIDPPTPGDGTRGLWHRGQGAAPAQPKLNPEDYGLPTPAYYGGGLTQLDGIYDYNQNIHPYFAHGGQHPVYHASMAPSGYYGNDPIGMDYVDALEGAGGPSISSFRNGGIPRYDNGGNIAVDMDGNPIIDPATGKAMTEEQYDEWIWRKQQEPDALKTYGGWGLDARVATPEGIFEAQRMLPTDDQVAKIDPEWNAYFNPRTQEGRDLENEYQRRLEEVMAGNMSGVSVDDQGRVIFPHQGKDYRLGHMSEDLGVEVPVEDHTITIDPATGEVEPLPWWMIAGGAAAAAGAYGLSRLLRRKVTPNQIQDLIGLGDRGRKALAAAPDMLALPPASRNPFRAPLKGAEHMYDLPKYKVDMPFTADKQILPEMEWLLPRSTGANKPTILSRRTFDPGETMSRDLQEMAARKPKITGRRPISEVEDLLPPTLPGRAGEGITEDMIRAASEQTRMARLAAMNAMDDPALARKLAMRDMAAEFPIGTPHLDNLSDRPFEVFTNLKKGGSYMPSNPYRDYARALEHGLEKYMAGGSYTPESHYRDYTRALEHGLPEYMAGGSYTPSPMPMEHWDALETSRMRPSMAGGGMAPGELYYSPEGKVFSMQEGGELMEVGELSTGETVPAKSKKPTIRKKVVKKSTSKTKGSTKKK